MKPHFFAAEHIQWEEVTRNVNHRTYGQDEQTYDFLPRGGPGERTTDYLHSWMARALDQLAASIACSCGPGVSRNCAGHARLRRSSIYPRSSDYAQELIVQDMLDLLDSLGKESAVWVGHDWGSPVVWNLASHNPDRCEGVANLCVPYYTLERGLDHLLTLVDRKVYPEAEYPAGQWDYMRYYEENFAEAIAPRDANVYKFLNLWLAFRMGSPEGEGKPAITATARRNHGMLGGGNIPNLPRDGDVVSEEDLSVYVSAFERNGFFGPSSWYLNHTANAEYARAARNDSYLDMPVLFLNARYDYVWECTHSRLAEPMHNYCRNLTEETIRTGHWMAQEKPGEVNAALVKWLATSVPGVWPRPS